jgi:serpin B
MMHQTHLLTVLQNDRFQAVRLPYGGGRISMVIVLPRSGRTLDSLASELTTGEWSDWMTSMSAATVDLTVPRFHIEYAAGLVDALKSIGVTDAFEGRRADFGPMSETPMFVSDVVHKTTLDVDEAGTTATAATAITMMPTLAAPRLNPPIVIRVDHPFLCAIQDDQTGALIFVGLIRDPQGAK